MLGLNRSLLNRSDAEIATDRDSKGQRRKPSILSAVRADPWKNIGYAEFANTIRRVCTLCGWAQDPTGDGQALAITSAVQGEGKSTLARAVAIATAQDHACDVLLLECDLLNPILSADFEVAARPGLVEMVTEQAPLDAALRPTTLSNLWLLPAGAPQDNPARVLRSAEMSTLLRDVRRRFSFIVIDLPAVLRSSDAAVLARQSDGAVFVIRAGSTDQRAVQRALQLLSSTPLHGVVLNRWRSQMPDLVRRVVEM